MTENEAIEELKYDCNELGKAIPCDTSWGKSFENAYAMAIKALEEVQQYRAIGTPEECRKSADICKAMAERRISLQNMEDYMKFEDECVKRGFTFNSLLEAREKQEPKKPTDRCMYKECPACGEVEIEFCKYCPSCGQKLDWRNEE
jgi:hypothetical protein